MIFGSAHLVDLCNLIVDCGADCGTHPSPFLGYKSINHCSHVFVAGMRNDFAHGVVSSGPHADIFGVCVHCMYCMQMRASVNTQSHPRVRAYILR